jgi:predicted MPP superfamily phosphohydrolase
MKILHITDLHYTNTMGSLTKQKNLIRDFLSDISKNDYSVDYVIFSGDLVNSGENITVFNKAYQDFIMKIIEILNIDKSNFFICAGNHDVNRNEVSKSLIKFLDEEITNNKSLDNFFKTNSQDLKKSYLPLQNYSNFINEFYKESLVKNDFFENMFSTHIRKKDNQKIGFVSINTAWRAVGDNDNNNLLFPLSKIDEALDKIINCDTKILIHHHPLSDFKPFNKYDLEDILHKRFDYIFSGHIHKKALTLDLTHNEGVVKIGSSASLTFDNSSQIGYSIIDINEEELKVTSSFRFYDINNECFYSIEDKQFDIPTSQVKIEQNKLRKNIRKRFFEELEDSKNLFVENDNETISKNLLELSTEPVLKEKSQSEMVKDEDNIEADFVWSNFHKFENDYIIFGKDKCGKTILLKRIELELLDNYSLHNYIPFYIDIKEWKNSNKKFDFSKEFSRHYYLNNTESLKLLEDKQIVLLVDNYHFENQELKDYIETFVGQHKKIKLIICSIDSVINTFDKNKIDGRVLNKLHFHRLRKKHIKELAKINSDLSDEKQDQIVDKIDNIFKRLSIPFNYWTVSVFLWIFKKDLNANFHNDVDLINLYIERLIEKEQLTLNKSSFTFSNYKKLLANIAHYLLTEHHQDSYYAKYSDVIIFIENFLNKNPRYRISSKEVFEYLDSKGILKKKGDNLYSFRLKGVFEYFIAYYMTLNNKFLKSVIKDENFYLAFTNEFELYAGFNREDDKFLKKIYKKTRKIFEVINNEYDLSKSSADTLLISKIIEANDFSIIIEKFTKRLKDGLTSEEQDNIEEELINELGIDDTNSEVKSKQVKLLNNSAETLEGSLSILGKVYKNIDDITDVDLVYEIFDYIIDNAILWSYKLIDDFKDMDISEVFKGDSDVEAKNLLKLITNFIPTLVQVRLNEMIGHNNLEKIIIERLEYFKKDSQNNQFKIFILGFLLTDINIEKHKGILVELIPMIRIPIIKYSFILKMNYYLGFKCNHNPDLKKLLQNNIQNQYLKFNSDTDIGSIHRGFSERQNKTGLNR